MRAHLKIFILGQPILLAILLVSLGITSNGGRGTSPVVQATPLSQAPFDYIVIIVMNNASAAEVYGSSAAPYLNSLAHSYGYANSYAAVSEPVGLPDYLALVGGSTFGFTADCDPAQCPVSAVSIVDRIEAAGLTWKAWAEDYPVFQGCTSLPRNAEYVARHFPFVYFSKIIGSTTRCNSLLRANTVVVSSPGTETDDLFLKALDSTSSAANYMWLTPNQCDDVDHCSLSKGDTYLSRLVPNILDSYIFKTQKAALFITFAEGTSRVTSNTDYVPAIWAGPAAKTRFQSSNPYNHYSLLKTIETTWGLSSLTSKDGSAASMSEFFIRPQASFSYTPSTPKTGQAVTFTATVAGGLSPYTFAWTYGEGSTGTGNPTSHIYTAEGSFTVTLTVTDSNAASTTATKTVVVTPSLTAADFTLTPTLPEVGYSVSFTATQTGGVAPFTYNWNFGDGSQSRSGNPATHTYPTPESFIVTLTVKDANGDTAIATHTATVAPALAVASVTSSPNPSEVGVAVNFQATALGGVGTQTFSWDFGDGSPTATGNPASHTYTNPGSFTVTVTVSDGNGATGTRSATEVVNPSLAVVPAASPNPSTTVDPVSFAAGTSGGVGAATCTWTFGDGSEAAGCIVTHTYSVAGNFTAKVTATDSLVVKATGRVSVEITNACRADFAWSPSLPEGGQPVAFNATTANCTSPITFTWDFDDGNSGIGNPVTDTYPVAGGSFTVILTVTDATGLTSTKSHFVVVAARLAVEFTFEPAAPEGGQATTFTATSTGGVGAKACNWSFGDGGNANACTVTHTFGEVGGTFFVSLNVTDGNAITASSSQSLVIVPRLSGVDFSFNPSWPEAGQLVTFAAEHVAGVLPYSYEWNFGDGSPSASGNPATHLYAASGTFAVTLTVTDANGIAATASHVLFVAAPLTVDFASSPITAEGGQTVTFVASRADGVGSVSFIWDFGDGSAAGSGNAVPHIYAEAGGTFNVTLTGSDANGVTATKSHSLTIALRLSNSDFTFNPANPEGGQSIVFMATSTGGVGTKACNWAFGDGSTAAGYSVAHTYSDTGGTFVVKATIVDANGMSATKSYTVVVATRLSADFTIAPGPPGVGFSVNLTATRTGGVEPFTYTWDFGDGSPTAAGRQASHLYTASGIFTVTLSLKDRYSITASTAHSISIGAANKPPDFSSLPSFQTVNTGQPLTFIITASDPEGGAVSILAETLPDGASFDPGSREFFWVPTDGLTGNFSITFTATDSGIPPMITSKTITIQVKPPTEELCKKCSRILGLPLDDMVVASLAFLGVLSAVIVTVVVQFRDRGESDAVGHLRTRPHGTPQPRARRNDHSTSGPTGSVMGMFGNDPNEED